MVQGTHTRGTRRVAIEEQAVALSTLAPLGLAAGPVRDAEVFQQIVAAELRWLRVDPSDRVATGARGAGAEAVRAAEPQALVLAAPHPAALALAAVGVEFQIVVAAATAVVASAGRTAACCHRCCATCAVGAASSAIALPRASAPAGVPRRSRPRRDISLCLETGMGVLRVRRGDPSVEQCSAIGPKSPRPITRRISAAPGSCVAATGRAHIGRPAT